MKHLFLILAFVASTVAVNAQTKEETITWLKEKLTTHFYQFPRECKIGCSYTLQSVEVNECEIKYKIKYWWGYQGGTTEEYTYILPTQDLSITNGRFSLNYEGIKVIQTSSTNEYSVKNYGLPGPYKIDSMKEFGVNTSGEVDLNNRILKAITHLATFCPKKEKETF